MKPIERIRQLKEEFQADLSEETNKANRLELVRAINALFDIVKEK